jgi:hypothetical protein
MTRGMKEASEVKEAPVESLSVFRLAFDSVMCGMPLEKVCASYEGRSQARVGRGSGGVRSGWLINGEGIKARTR